MFQTMFDAFFDRYYEISSPPLCQRHFILIQTKQYIQSIYYRQYIIYTENWMILKKRESHLYKIL